MIFIIDITLFHFSLKGISLMEQMYFGSSQVPVQTPELEEEKEFQTTTKERPVTVTSPVKIFFPCIKVIVCLLLIECWQRAKNSFL